VLAFVLGCALLSTLLFGVAPAFTGAGVDLNDALRSGGRGTTSGGRHGFRSVLVVVQVALSLILLTGAALLGKSFLHLLNVNPGFQPEHVLTATVNIPGLKYRTVEQTAAFHQTLLERTLAMPGVQAAGLTDILPLSGDDSRMGVVVEGFEPRKGEPVRMHPRLVSTGYLDAMGIRLLQGRMLTDADIHPKRVAIVNEVAAKLYWPDSSPLGKRFRFNNDTVDWMEVVGVVGSVHNDALDRESTADVYLPSRDTPYPFPMNGANLVVRSNVAEGSLATSIRTMVASMDRSVAVSGFRSMESQLAESVAPKRFNVVLLGLFAAMAVLLAAAGLYGVLAYLVNQRTSEIGIRMALGAGKREVLGLILGRALLLACAGIVLGTAVSLAATQAMSKLLFGVAPRDPMTFVIIPLFLAGVTLLASYVPAYRATRVDPLTALRME